MAHPDTALILVDVVMEAEDAGLTFVQYVRETLENDLVQVVIRTGQPGYAPEDQVISRYKINSYFSKTEVTAQSLSAWLPLPCGPLKFPATLRRNWKGGSRPRPSWPP